jgi:hypothetical protein
LTSSSYLAEKYGFNSSILIIPSIWMVLALILAFDSGEQWGRKRQQRDITEALIQHNGNVLAEMEKIRLDKSNASTEPAPSADHQSPTELP